MISCFPVLRGAQQLQLCCCQYVSIIYSLKLYCFRLVPLIYDVKMWALNMQDWLYFFWAYWASWVWAGHEDTDTWHEDTNLCRTCDILTRSLVLLTWKPLLEIQSKRWSNRICRWLIMDDRWLPVSTLSHYESGWGSEHWQRGREHKSHLISRHFIIMNLFYFFIF